MKKNMKHGEQYQCIQNYLVLPLKAEPELSPLTANEVQLWLLTLLGSFSRDEVAQHLRPCPAML